MSKCIATLKACQSVDARLDYAFNFTREFARLWQADHPFVENQVVRPNELPGTGFEYKSSGGVSNGQAEPEWPTALAGEVADGSITWTAQEMTNDGLRHRISSVNWSGPSDLTLDGQEEIDEPGHQGALIWVSDGVAGQTYEIEGEITTDQGAIFVVRIEMKIVS